MNRYALIMVFTLSACSTTAVRPNLVDIDLPPVGQQASAAPGNVILDKAKYQTTVGLNLDGDLVWEAGALRIRHTVFAGVILPVSRDTQYTYFVSQGMVQDVQDNEGFHIKTAILDGPDADIPIDDIIPGTIFNSFSSRPNIRKSRLRLFDGASYEKQLVYRGRAGNQLQFEYRGRVGQANGSEVVQQLDWSIDDGRIVPLAGARIEILDITGAQITYRILSSFPDQ